MVGLSGFGCSCTALDRIEAILKLVTGWGKDRPQAKALMMSPEAWTILAVGTALGGLVWQMLRSLRQISENFRDVRNRLDRLASDHHSLARELSELRGELRGRLDERARPTPG